MPRDGSGNYTPPPAVNPVVPNTVITTNWANTTIADLGAALTQSLSRDGQAIPTANLPMGGYRHTNVADPTARSQYASLGIVQDNRHEQVIITNSDPNNITGNMAVGAPVSYSAGMNIWFRAAAANTGAVTININGIGIRPVLNQKNNPLEGNDLAANAFYSAQYNDSIASGAFVLTVQTSNELSDINMLATSGSYRPTNSFFPVFPDITISGSDVVVPAGTALISKPDAFTGRLFRSEVSWSGGSYPLAYLSTASGTTLLVDQNGDIIQRPNRVSLNDLRNFAIIGYVSHPENGVIRALTSPYIAGDDNYRAADLEFLATNSLVSGGVVSQNSGSSKSIDITAGLFYKVGASQAVIHSPNILIMMGGASVTFQHFNGTLSSNYGSPVAVVDTANYDPNFLTNGALSAIPAGEWVFHRLYYLYGNYILVYGQKSYAASTAGEALAYLQYDNGKFTSPVVLQDAAAVAVIMVKSGATALDDGIDGCIINKGSMQFGIQTGSSAGFNDAPSDGITYGRKNGAWEMVISGASPVFSGSGILAGNNAVFDIRELSGSGFGGLTLSDSAGTKVAAIEKDAATGIVYFDSYDSSNVLQSRWSWDTNTGQVALVGGSTIGSDAIGNVVASATPVTDSSLALYDGTTGKLLKDGILPQQTTTDFTAGRVVLNGGYGLGTTEAFQAPAGTTAQRPSAPSNGQIRYNSDLQAMESYTPAGWVAQQALPPNYCSGFDMVLTPVYNGYREVVRVEKGKCVQLEEVGYSPVGSIATKMDKNLKTAWSAGDGGGGKGFPTPYVVNTWYRLFAVWNADGVIEIGTDTSDSAANLLIAASKTYYRRIGWVKCFSVVPDVSFTPFSSHGNEFSYFGGVASTVASFTTNYTNYYAGISTPPNVLASVCAGLQITSGGTNVVGTGTLADNKATHNVTFASNSGNIFARRSGSTDTEDFSYVKVWTRPSLTMSDGEAYLRINMSATANAVISLYALGWNDQLLIK